MKLQAFSPRWGEDAGALCAHLRVRGTALRQTPSDGHFSGDSLPRGVAGATTTRAEGCGDNAPAASVILTCRQTSPLCGHRALGRARRLTSHAATSGETTPARPTTSIATPAKPRAI